MNQYNQDGLSPEKYIKSKGRKLQIDKCFINDNWKSSGFATCLVIRKHKGGTFTHAFYQLDLLAEGIVNTIFEFSIKSDQYDNILKYYKEKYDLISCNYDLIHQLVYGVNEFANNFGLKAHKDFDTTKYLLEDQSYKATENLEFVFGEDNKPLVVISSFEDKSSLIAKLDRTIGRDAYKVVHLSDLENEEDDHHHHHHHHDHDHVEDENSFSFDLPDNIDPASKLDKKNIENWTDKDWEEFENGEKEVSAKTTLQIIDYLYDSHFVEQNPSNLLNENNINLDSIEISKELIEENRFEIDEELEKKISNLYLNILDKPSEKELNELIEVNNSIDNYPPIYSYISNAYLKLKDVDNSDKWTKLAFEKFPEYLFAKISHAQVLLQKGEYNSIPSIFDNKYDLQAILPNRKVFHILEVVNFYSIMTLYFTTQNDVDSANIYWKELKKLDEENEELYLLAENELMVLKAKYLKSQE